MDIVSRILNRLPPSFLYENCRFACKSWEELLRCPKFVNPNLPHTHPFGLLIHKVNPAASKSLGIRSVGIKDLNNIQFNDLNLHFWGRIICSSDGVVLILKYTGIRMPGEHYIANPVTRQIVELPHPNDSDLSLEFSGIARIPSTGELKVVVLAKFPQELLVLTVGDAMRWRKLSFPPGIRTRQHMVNRVCSVAGVVYSTISTCLTYDSIFAVDLHDESLHNVMLPEKSGYWEKEKTIVCSMDNLYLMDEEPIRNNRFLRLWLLKDLHRGEWARMRNLNISRIPYLEIFPTPLLWLKSERVLVVKNPRMYLEGLEDGNPGSSRNVSVMVAYCLRSGKCKLLAECSNDESLLALWHIDSLVRF